MERELIIYVIKFEFLDDLVFDEEEPTRSGDGNHDKKKKSGFKKMFAKAFTDKTGKTIGDALGKIFVAGVEAAVKNLTKKE